MPNINSYSLEIKPVKKTFNFSNANNGASQAITMPFPFRFYCANSTSVRAYTDGYISFLNTGASIPNNAPFPTAVMPNSLIALMWDDLVDSASASGYFVSGTAPYRKMVMEFILIKQDNLLQLFGIKK